MFELISFLAVIIFIVVIGSLVLKGGTALGEWSDNNDALITSVQTKVIIKRVETQTLRNHHSNSSFHARSTSQYFMTFDEVEGTTRHALKVKRKVYDLNVEGDIGKLTYQGTRFISFSR